MKNVQAAGSFISEYHCGCLFVVGFGVYDDHLMDVMNAHIPWPGAKIDSGMVYGGCCRSYAPDYRLIVLWVDSVDSLDILVHECCHAAWRVMEWLGLERTNEANAYTVDYIFRKCMEIRNSALKGNKLVKVTKDD